VRRLPVRRRCAQKSATACLKTRRGSASENACQRRLVTQKDVLGRPCSLFVPDLASGPNVSRGCRPKRSSTACGSGVQQLFQDAARAGRRATAMAPDCTAPSRMANQDSSSARAAVGSRMSSIMPRGVSLDFKGAL